MQDNHRQSLSMLHVHSSRIVDAAGRPVRLRGVCIGGWMNMEGFINGFPGVEQDLRAVFAEVLGPGRAGFFFERLLDHFLAEDDIAFIKASGANVVRLPLNCRHFEPDDEPFRYLEAGFERLDRVLGWCARHGLYAILDLHAVPGWQNPDWHSDNPTGHALFWRHPHFQDRFVGLWREMARRFSGNPAVAGYDLMNEPLTNPASERQDQTYRPDWKAMNGVYRRAVRAIREVDPDHIVFLEGDGFSVCFDGLDAPFDSNLAYSCHVYNRAGWGPGRYPGTHREGLWDRARLAELFGQQGGQCFARQHRVPLWVGEFGSVFNGPPEDRPDRLRGMDDQIDVFEEFGAHWTAWTFKDAGVMGWTGLDPESDYLRITAPLLRAKLRLHTDSWMYWLPMSPAKAMLGDLAGQVAEEIGGDGLDVKRLHGQLIKAALGETVGALLQPEFARCFAGMSEAELDRVLQSFAFKNCRPNRELMGIVGKHMARPAVHPAVGAAGGLGMNGWQSPMIAGQ